MPKRLPANSPIAQQIKAKNIKIAIISPLAMTRLERHIIKIEATIKEGEIK